jgi:hypothetical protein
MLMLMLMRMKSMLRSRNHLLLRLMCSRRSKILLLRRHGLLRMVLRLLLRLRHSRRSKGRGSCSRLPIILPFS